MALMTKHERAKTLPTWLVAAGLLFCILCDSSVGRITSSSSSQRDSMSLLGGRYETTTNVEKWLNLAADVGKMKQATISDDKQYVYSGSER